VVGMIISFGYKYKRVINHKTRKKRLSSTHMIKTAQ